MYTGAGSSLRVVMVCSDTTFPGLIGGTAQGGDVNSNSGSVLNLFSSEELSSGCVETYDDIPLDNAGDGGSSASGAARLSKAAGNGAPTNAYSGASGSVKGGDVNAKDSPVNLWSSELAD
jgi:hypothetical protein